MSTRQVVVIGAGLAGLYTAHALHSANVDVLIIEARDRIGGRILTADDAGLPADDGFDLGPSWYWPQMQPAMEALVAELGLESFHQNSVGDVIFEKMSREQPQRYSPAMENHQSMRLFRGTSATVRALAERLPAGSIRLQTTVTAVSLADAGVELTLKRTDGNTETLLARRVVAALPPRLLEATVSFSPPQDSAMAARWRATPTWMAPHAKFFAVYDEAFWKTNGLSGTAQSMVGPMVEIHDATTASGKAALFGFLGVGAGQRKALGEEALKKACLAQLGKLFGKQALRPRATILKDWAADPLTATATDLSDGSHPEAGNPQWVSGPWEGCLLLAGSETSPIEPGYLAGAVVAAKIAAEQILANTDIL
ncbi:FAD-dependent oxidoreductase [Rhizobium jaguaris]|uniref:FAD-binding protein n=1 Tax=Rhizobium jaguaris TaxID=1312183 RepID=A0A387FUP1_9HYPH|nr:FAD-dependent oxidoreductase [Rhizobium jaguaris]AYG59122.1 FAD-binding protein [Rhizobium jaguaris]